MRRAALIFNPRSGSGGHARLLEEILGILRRDGYAVEPVPTGGPGAATELARGAAARGAEAVFAYGGDGTAREVAAGLLGTETALGVIPGGTVNLLAHALELPSEPLLAAAELGRLPAQLFDVGIAGETPFLMMVSAGVDAAVLSALDHRMKWAFGRAAIAAEGLRTWWRYRYPRLGVETGRERFQASFAAVANIPFYAGELLLAPGARADDGRLDLVAFRGRGRLATIAFAVELLRAAHPGRADVEVRRLATGAEVVLSGPADVPVQVDGDVCPERLPLRIRLAPARLRVLAPAAAKSGEKPAP
jgi:diacylglycerol kinase (ATP)